MSATTIKVEGALLKELNQIRPSTLSLSAFVRSVLENEILRRKMADAAQRYAQFLKDNADETAWLEEWESARLNEAPKPSIRKP